MTITGMFRTTKNAGERTQISRSRFLERCEQGFAKKKSTSGDDDPRNSADYDKAINFLEDACGSTLDQLLAKSRKKAQVLSREPPEDCHQNAKVIRRQRKRTGVLPSSNDSRYFNFTHFARHRA